MKHNAPQDKKANCLLCGSRVGRFLPGILSLPLVEELVPGGLDYGTLLLAEFEPHSLWYDAVFTIAVQALRKGIRVDFHAFHRSPSHVREVLTKFGLDVPRLQDEDALRIIDSYTLQTGLGAPEKPKGADELFNVAAVSVKLSEWPLPAKEQFDQGIPESEKRRLHIDDDLTIITRYNKEEEILDFWRTRVIPLFRARESILVNALEVGVVSDRFIKQFEALSDGIIDFSSREEEGRVRHYVRMRTLHGKTHDSSWRPISQSNEGLVTVGPSETKIRPAEGALSRATDRALTTILFLDIVGSTEHLATLGDRKWSEVMSRHNEIVRRELANHRGHEVKTMGDGFIATFDVPTRAVQCARRIRDSVRQLGIEIRAGLHTGEHDLVGDDLRGTAVNTAARVLGMAGPGQILVSNTVRELVAGSDLRFEDYGFHILKGIPGEFHLFLLV